MYTTRLLERRIYGLRLQVQGLEHQIQYLMQHYRSRTVQPAVNIGSPFVESGSTDSIRRHTEEVSQESYDDTEQHLATDSISDIQRLISINPDDAELRILYSSKLMDLGNVAAATREASIAVELMPESYYPHIHLGWILMEQHAFEDGIIEMERALNLVQMDSGAHEQREALVRWGYGMAWGRLGDTDRAETEFYKSIDLFRSAFNNGSCSAFTLGQYEYELGQFIEQQTQRGPDLSGGA